MHIRGDHAELVVGGRLDVRSAADARTVLHSAVDDGVGDLVLDLSELDSWDATGLGVIMGAHRRAGRCGRRLVLRDVPPQMQRLLVATRLHRILAIEGASGWTRCPACRGVRVHDGRAGEAGPTPANPAPRAQSSRDRDQSDALVPRAVVDTDRRFRVRLPAALQPSSGPGPEATARCAARPGRASATTLLGG